MHDHDLEDPNAQENHLAMGNSPALENLPAPHYDGQKVLAPMRLFLSVRQASNAHGASQKLKPEGVALMSKVCWMKPQDADSFGEPLYGSYTSNCKDRKHRTKGIELSFNSGGDGNEGETMN